MNVKEWHRTYTSMTEVEFIHLESTDGSKCRENVSTSVGERIGHHTSIRESTTVNALAVHRIVLFHVFNNSLNELDISIDLTRRDPTRRIHSSQIKIHRLSLWIDDDETFIVSYLCRHWTVSPLIAISTMERHHQRSVIRHISRHIQSIRTCLCFPFVVFHGDVHNFVHLRRKSLHATKQHQGKYKK